MPSRRVSTSEEPDLWRHRVRLLYLKGNFSSGERGVSCSGVNLPMRIPQHGGTVQEERASAAGLIRERKK